MAKIEIRGIKSKTYRGVMAEPELMDCEIIKENKSTAVVYVPVLGETLTVKRNKLIYD